MTGKLRLISQGFFLVLFIILFFKVSYPFTNSLVDNFFYNLDPLITFIMLLTGSIVVTALIGSTLTFIATVLCGRVFCGWMCPLGTVFDVSARMFPRLKNRKPFGKGRYKTIKYYSLNVMFFSSLVGFTFLLQFDPLVFLFRVLTLTVSPFLNIIANFFLNLIRPAALKFGAYELSMVALKQQYFHHGLLHLVIFIGVLGLLAYERRFWCRNLCPLGAFLAIVSRFSVMGRKVSIACTQCSKCAQTCPMNAIGDDFSETSSQECIQCQRCAEVCPVYAVSFSFSRLLMKSDFNLRRRVVVFSSFGGILAGLSAGSSVAAKTRAGNLIRPPGALLEKDFLDACLRCGECMKGCPTHGLQPGLFQSGFEGLFTPVLVPRIGGCEEQCNLCCCVCPTGAIRSLPLVEKQYAVIGNAVIERHLCIAWEQGKVCLICDEVCPYDAVEFRLVIDEKGAIKRPFVIEDKCVGCGQCENACPVNGPAAIHVTPINEVRKNSGSYITEKVKRLRKVEDDFVDFSKEKGVQPVETVPLPSESPADSFDNDIPAGFIK